jgi:hypothetical protein
VLPPPGLSVRMDEYYYYGVEHSYVPQGNLTVAGKAWASIVAAIYVTPYRIWGADYAVAVRLADSYIAATQTLVTPGPVSTRDGNIFGFNDIVVSPIYLGWHNGNWHWNISGTFWAPVGVYDKTRVVNGGKNFWAVSPQLAVTHFDPKTGWEISLALTYVVNFQNPATQYRSGADGHIETMVAKNLTPQFKLGLNSYLIHQLSDDSGAGATLGARRLRVAGIGPAASYTFKIDKVPVNLVAKYFREFDAQNTTQGDVGTLSLRVKF